MLRRTVSTTNYKNTVNSKAPFSVSWGRTLIVAWSWLWRSALLSLPILITIILISEYLSLDLFEPSEQPTSREKAVLMFYLFSTSYVGLFLTLKKIATSLPVPQDYVIDVRWRPVFIVWLSCLMRFLLICVFLGIGVIVGGILLSKINKEIDGFVTLTALAVTPFVSSIVALRWSLQQSPRFLARMPPGIEYGRFTTQSYTLGVVWMIVSFGLAVGGIFLGYDLYMRLHPTLSRPALTLSLLGACVLWIPGWYLWHRSRKHFVKVGHRLEDDPRAPILFLRPFDQDGALAYPRIDMNPKTYLRGVIAYLRSYTHYEDFLVHAFRKVGPLVAVGEPGEKLPETGAMRVYFPRSDEIGWRECVQNLIAKSQIVLLQVGASEGLSWEVEEVTQALRSSPSKLVLCIPMPSGLRLRTAMNQDGVRRNIYRSFRVRHVDKFQAGLPDDVGSAQFVCFDDESQPYFLQCRSEPILGPREATAKSALAWLSAALVKSH